MSIPAFYLPPEKWGDEPDLDESEARHCHVLRLKEGGEALLLDGKGRIAGCRITRIMKKSVSLRIVSEKFVPPPAARPTMALALSKAVRRDFFMEKAAELGAWAIWLWDARRGQGRLDEDLARAVRGKLIAGIKQSHNPWLPETRVFRGAEDIISASANFDWKIQPWEKSDGVPMASPDRLGMAGDTIYVIGPEGGFDETELELLAGAGFSAVSFGDRVLRCETAATLCLGLHWWASQLPGHPDFRRAEK
ncbi:MAG: 16S rRNA (uracil(1498)-N(3))-methyltransferase [Desulfovibrio sp.]|nr:16S rRNA (uracil(1498)-N(3))-methyltransferase [Desulfovibrio sp.]